MTKPAPAKIISANDHLRSKTSPLSDKEFQRLLSMAEASVASLGASYAETVAEAATRLSRLAADAVVDESGREPTLEKIRDMAFELRGEGGSFGFDVVSQVADSLYRLVERCRAAPQDFELNVVQMHALALNSLLAGGIRSATDDPVAAEIVGALAAAKMKADAQAA